MDAVKSTLVVIIREVIGALDALPLPFLVIAFLILLTLSRYSSKPHSTLPLHSPPSLEKRLTPPQTPQPIPSQYYTAVEVDGKAQYVMVAGHDGMMSSSISSSGSSSPPRLVGGVGGVGFGRRGSRGLGFTAGRGMRGGLGIVEEEKGEV